MSYTLRYFNARGVAEQIRVLFALAKAEYVDSRFPIDFTTFARPEFDAERDAGSFSINMNRLPILDYKGADGDFSLGQSKSIEKFIARKHGLLGSSEIEAAQIDMITEHVRDIKQKYNDSKAGKKDEELAAAKQKFLSEDLPTWLAKLEKTLSGNNGFAVGQKISLADVAIHNLIKDYFDDLVAASAATSSTPRVAASAESVASAASDYFASRPVTKF